MSKGILVFAFNNEQIDYIKQAIDLANRAKRYLGLPTTLITDIDIVNDAFDSIVKFSGNTYMTQKTYRNGTDSVKLNFKNCARISAYELTPYDETIILDSDFIICNNDFLKCFEQDKTLLMYHNSFDLTGSREITNEFKWISDTGPKFYWATCVYFKKSKFAKIFFELLEHIYENYSYYRVLYQLETRVYRNDFAFSIAAHILNDFVSADSIGEFPGTKYYVTDRDTLLELDNDKILFLSEKNTVVRTSQLNVHCMNKFSLDKIL
jgi:hypothetical protein